MPATSGAGVAVRRVGQPGRRRSPSVVRRTFTALSGWLVMHALDAADSMEGSLAEAATVMVGYLHELQRQGEAYSSSR